MFHDLVITINSLINSYCHSITQTLKNKSSYVYVHFQILEVSTSFTSTTLCFSLTFKTSITIIPFCSYIQLAFVTSCVHPLPKISIKPLPSQSYRVENNELLISDFRW